MTCVLCVSDERRAETKDGCYLSIPSKGRTIRKLMGEGAKYKKKYSRKGELNEKKNSCTPTNPKKYATA